MKPINTYYDSKLIAERIHAGQHREMVGGMWDEIGKLQFDYIVANGLTSEMNFLDVGCGCFRGGVHFIDHLNSGNYYGIDLSQDLMNAGYNTELKQLNLQAKLPRRNLHCTDDFEATEFEVSFDIALALSVFTHLPLNHLRLCLSRLTKIMRPRGCFFVTVFNVNDGDDWSRSILHSPGDITTYPDRDPFHYHLNDLAYCCEGLPWKLEKLEDWNHPRDQWIATFVRTED